MAQRKVADAGSKPDENLGLLGLVGMHDLPRRAVKDAIASCCGAGVRVVMVTGDQHQPATAGNIAQAVGIVDDKQPSVLSGQDLGDVDTADRQRREQTRKASVFAVVSPEQKLSLISLYQNEGKLVGMTGDGVNDAPALNVDKITTVTISLLTYGFARLWHVFNMRSVGTGVFDNNIVRNPFVWGALVLCRGLRLSAVYLPFRSSLLTTQPLVAGEWTVVSVGSLASLILGQIGFAIAHSRRRQRNGVGMEADAVR